MDGIPVRSRRILASLLLAALIVLALPATARAGNVHVSGAGAIITNFSPVTTATFSVSVRLNTANGRIAGTLSFEPWGIVEAPVTCLDVRGDDSVVIGGVAETNSIVPEPLIFAFYFVDGGTPGAGVDFFAGESHPSRGSVADAAFCGDPGRNRVGSPIASGEITIRIHGRTPPQDS
jgi:hypothetical protein